MKLSDFIIENKNDSYYAYHDAAKKWSEDTGKPERDFGRAGVNVQDKYIQPEMKKRGLVPDSYMGAGVTKYRREGVEVDEVAGAKDCWDGYKKDGTQPGTGKNKGKRVNKCVKEEDNFVYASDLLYFDKDGKEIGYMDFDGYDDANTGHSEQELQAIAQKFNISPKDGKVVGYFNASDDEVDFSDDSNDETYPEGSIGVYIDSHSKEESVEETEESAGEYSYSLEYNGEENGYSKHILTITNPDGETKVIADDFTYFDVEGDELQAELESWFHKGMGVADASVNEAEEGMIGQPDNFYDAEQRQEAYNDLQDALQGNYMDDYIKDGVCPACGGSGYMDGEDTFTNDDGEEEESSECDGFGNYGCDEGEMTYGSDGPSWVEIIKHDERKAEKANRGPAPSKEQIMKLLPILHKDYVQSGRYNAFELGGILRQMYPELGKRQASGYVADFFSTFSESAIHEGNKGEGDVAKMLSKALGDENRWTEMSPYELYAELESQNPEVADMLAKVAKQLYDVKLKERTYKDVGVADVQKDLRGKEFKFNKDSKQFKSQDGELAAINTKVGKDLMKKRKSAMRKSTPSAHKKKAPNRPSLMSRIFRK